MNRRAFLLGSCVVVLGGAAPAIPPSAPQTLSSLGLATTPRVQDLLAQRLAATEAAGAFPPSLGGMVSLWLDAGKGVLTTAGAFPSDQQVVASWTDVRPANGGLSALQATAGSQPTWVQSAYGPIPSLQFYGGQSLTIADTDALRPDSSAFRVFMVVRDGSDVYSRVSAYLAKGNATSSAIGYSLNAEYNVTATDSQGIFVRAGGASSSKGSETLGFTSTAANTDMNLLELALDGVGTITGFLNGSATNWIAGGLGPTTNAYTPPISNTDALVIGTGCTMDLFALCIVKGTMTTDQINQVRNYLQTLFPAITPPAAVYGNEQILFTSSTDPVYRIPALVRCNNGTILAFCEQRTSSADNAPSYTLCRASTDGGTTWGAPVTVAGDGVNCWHNPAVIVDRTTGIVHALISWQLATDTQATIIAGTSTGTSHCYWTYSNNNGATWSTPVDISAQVKQSGDTWFAGGPGGFEMLASGRLLVPTYYGNPTLGTASVNDTQTRFVYSDNHGVTWNIGPASGVTGTGEASMTQRASDGEILLTLRNSTETSWRYEAYSATNGVTLTAPAQQNDYLTTPCQGGLAYVGGNVVVAAKPGLLNNPTRNNMTIIVSTDFGASWPASTVIYTGAAAYSSIVALGGGLFGILYEQGSGPNLAFGTFTVAYPKWTI